MKLLVEIPDHHYENIRDLDSVSLGRMPYKGIIMYSINAIKRAKPLPAGDFLAVCKSDYPLTEEVEKELKATVFISDEPRYCFEMTEIKELMNKATLTTVIPQEPILDKIRAEIQDIAFDWQEIDGEHESFVVVDLNDALNIIDKYKAKNEEV